MAICLYVLLFVVSFAGFRVIRSFPGGDFRVDHDLSGLSVGGFAGVMRHLYWCFTGSQSCYYNIYKLYCLPVARCSTE